MHYRSNHDVPTDVGSRQTKITCGIAQEIESIDSDTDSVTTYKHPYAHDSDYCSLTKKVTGNIRLHSSTTPELIAKKRR